jgi:peptide/nickel transport system permease protein
VRLIPGDVIDMMLSQNDVAPTSWSRDQLVPRSGWTGRSGRNTCAGWRIVLHGDLGNRCGRPRRSPSSCAAAAGHLRARPAGAGGRAVGRLPIGVYSAVRQDTAGDYLARSFSILMLAMPSFWLGTMVVVFPSIWWGWSPEVNYVPFFTKTRGRTCKQMLCPAGGAGLWRCRPSPCA